MMESLLAVEKNAVIYVLCMDKLCKDILDQWFSSRVITISLEEFEDDELLSVKSRRSKGEYCWTCTAKLIKYVISHYGCEMCTYVDSDLFFYSSPQPLFDEMIESGSEVQVVPHRFPPTLSGYYQEKKNGSNCVQFNTFSSSDQSMALLDKWIGQCIQDCSVENTGDQKYTSEWNNLSFVNVSGHHGAGIAPWNLTRYQYVDKETVLDYYNHKQYSIIFYHFQNIVYISRYIVKVMPKLQYWRIDNKLMNFFYIDYLVKIEKVKTLLHEKYNVNPLITKYIASKERSMKDKIKSLFHSSPSALFLKMDNKIREALREKESYINIEPYLH